MSVSAPSPGIHPSHQLTYAWGTVAVMVAMLVTMPMLGSVDWEPSFAVSASLFALFTFVLVALGFVAVRTGLHARDEGHGSGLLAAAIGGAIGGMFLLFALLVLVGHLIGFE